MPSKPRLVKRRKSCQKKRRSAVSNFQMNFMNNSKKINGYTSKTGMRMGSMAKKNVARLFKKVSKEMASLSKILSKKLDRIV